MRLTLFILLLAVECFGQAVVPNRRLAFRTVATCTPGTNTLTFTALGTNSSTTAALTYATPNSFSVSDGDLVLACSVSSLASGAGPTNWSGLGMSWTKILSTNFNAAGHAIAIFRGMTNNTTASGAMTAQFAANQTGCDLYVCKYGSVDTNGANGANAILQSMIGTNASANPSITLATLDGGAKNSVFAFLGNVDSNGGAIAAETDWTELLDEGYGTPATGMGGVNRLATTDNSIVVTQGAQQWAMIGLEIKAGTNCSPVGSGTAPTFITSAVGDFTIASTAFAITPSFTWLANDWIYVLGATADSARSINLPTNTVIGTFSLISSNSSGSDAKCYLWSAQAASGGTGTVGAPYPVAQNACGIAAMVYRNSTGSGTVAVTSPGADVTAMNLTRANANCAVIQIQADWAANVDDDLTGVTPTGFSLLSTNYSGEATFFISRWDDQGATGTTSYGVLGSAGTHDSTIITAEVKGQ